MNDETQITVEELDQFQREVFQAKAAHAAAKQATSELFATLKKLQGEHVERLEALGKSSYKTDAGLFSYTMVEGVKLDPMNKKEFWDYLKERNLFEDMITVNSNTLNSYAKGEFEQQLANGNFDPQIPGLIKNEPYAKPSMRKA